MTDTSAPPPLLDPLAAHPARVFEHAKASQLSFNCFIAKASAALSGASAGLLCVFALFAGTGERPSSAFPLLAGAVLNGALAASSLRNRRRWQREIRGLTDDIQKDAQVAYQLARCGSMAPVSFTPEHYAEYGYGLFEERKEINKLPWSILVSTATGSLALAVPAIGMASSIEKTHTLIWAVLLDVVATACLVSIFAARNQLPLTEQGEASLLEYYKKNGLPQSLEEAQAQWRHKVRVAEIRRSEKKRSSLD